MRDCSIADADERTKGVESLALTVPPFFIWTSTGSALEISEIVSSISWHIAKRYVLVLIGKSRQ